MEDKKYQIVLIRHGYSLGNALKTLSGQSDVPLMEKGRKELVEYREKYNYIDTDIYYSSDLSRCTSTFEALFGPEKKLDATFKELREINFKSRENDTFVSRDQLIEMFELWVRDDPSTNDVESFSEIRDRMVKMFYKTIDDLKSNNKKSATIVTHSCAMKCLLIGLGLYEREEYRNISVNNGQGYVINLEFDNDLKINECVNLFDYIK
ncbi:MAG: histidine phosphatase family protein [Pleomorphochaeta sp.]